MDQTDLKEGENLTEYSCAIACSKKGDIDRITSDVRLCNAKPIGMISTPTKRGSEWWYINPFSHTNLYIRNMFLGTFCYKRKIIEWKRGSLMFLWLSENTMSSFYSYDICYHRMYVVTNFCCFFFRYFKKSCFMTCTPLKYNNVGYNIMQKFNCCF